MDAEPALDGIVRPQRLWSRAELRQRPCPVPDRPGVYGWYFRQLPWPIDTSRCVHHDGHTLLNVGIAPKAHPPTGGRQAGRPFGQGSATTTAATPRAPPCDLFPSSR
jgi:hypothetical protein